MGEWSSQANEIGERIRTLLYIDAYAPTDGQSLVAITGAETALAFLDQANRHGGMIPPIPAAIFNVNEADAAWVDAMSVPQPLATFLQGVSGGCGFGAHCQSQLLVRDRERWGLVRSTRARLKDHPQWQVHTMPCGHAIMLDRPTELTALLLAEATRSRR
jgi:hypothetical protein